MTTNTQARRITDIIHECGVPAGIRGHEYIREAIAIAVKDATAVYAMTKRIYPAVAEKYGTTPSCAERAIRHALENAWLHGNIAAQEKYFGYISKWIATVVPRIAKWWEDLMAPPPTRHIFTDDLWVPFANLIEEYGFKLLGYTLDAFLFPLPSYIFIQFHTKKTMDEEQALELISHLSTVFEHYLRAYNLNMLYCPCYHIVGSEVTIYLYYCENSQDLAVYREKVRVIAATQTKSSPGQLQIAVKPPAPKTAVALGYAAKEWDEGGRKVPIYWDLMRNPHLLIAGVTGSGKSVLAQWVVFKLMRMGAQFYICDYKAGGDWTDACTKYAQFSGCDAVVEEFHTAFIKALESGVPAKRPQILLFDEFNSYALGKSSADFKALMDKVRDVAQMGRSYNFHLILVGQQFSAKVLETGIREQLSTRVYMGRTISSESAQMLFPGCDIDKGTVLGKYRGYVITADRGFEIMAMPEFDQPDQLLPHIQALGHRK